MAVFPRLKTILEYCGLFISLFSFSFCVVNHKPNFIPSIPRILQGVTNCDVRILWNGLEEIRFHTDDTDYHQLPTTVIFVPHYLNKYFYREYWKLKREDLTFALNIVQTRIQVCVINLLFVETQSVLQNPTHDSANYFISQTNLPISLYFGIAYSTYLNNKNQWIQGYGKMYTILVTESQAILKQARFKLLVGHSIYVENFAIVFPSETMLQDEGPRLEICVVVRTVDSDLSKTSCSKLIQEDKNLIAIINQSWEYFPYWFYYILGKSMDAEIYPFDRFSNKSIDLYLFTQLAQKENITIYTTCPPFNCEAFPNIIHMQFLAGEIPNQVIFTKFKGTQWLTCYTKKFLSFDFYWAPFQLELWISFFVTMSTVIGVSWIYTKYNFDGSFSAWLFVLGTIFEETSSAPASLEKKTFYRLSIGIWCLMVAILTNCYNGLMITGLNSPLPGLKIESFRDLLCDQSLFDAKENFNMTQWVKTSKINWYWDEVANNALKNVSMINPYETKDCFRIWSPLRILLPVFALPDNELFWQMANTYTYDLQTRTGISQGGTKHGLHPYYEKIMLSFLHPGHAREPQEMTKFRSQKKRLPTGKELLSVADELEITNCEQKSAYISNSDQIALEMDFFSRYYKNNFIQRKMT